MPLSGRARQEVATVMGVSQELIKGTVVPVVLALLKDRPRYGYEMVQLVNARTNGALDWSEGTLYPVLHRLESDGLVSAEWRERPPKSDAESGPSTGGARRRRYYTLTRAGRRELDRRATEWRAFTAAVGEFLGRTSPTGVEHVTP
jgi:DNA-binding PadR family transcriptional regulator